MTCARDPYDTGQPPCFCGQQAPAPVRTTPEFCPACGDPAKPAPEPPRADWLAEAFERAERDLASLPGWARPVTVQPVPSGVPGDCPDSKMDDGSHEDSLAPGGEPRVCGWCYATWTPGSDGRPEP